MSKLNRRDFIKNSMIAGATIAMATPFSRVRGANNDIRIAVVGTGGQGGGHCQQWSRMEGVRLVAICDADLSQAERAKRRINMPDLKVYQDIRELLDDKSVDAISSATPNHWHSLVTVWACQAGKDVYIEKPASHEIWEGRKMVEAARKYNRIVQIGTQKRSSMAHKEAFEWIHAGNIGAIKWSRGFCYKPRGIGTNGIVNATNGPNPLPDSLDYNLWCGPADMEPLRRERLHYNWHWVWNTGSGDVGNQGIHEMDLARWALGDSANALAPAVCSFGGRFGVFDAGETPNTLVSYFDYKPAPLIFEVRGLPSTKGGRSMDNFRGARIGIVVQCENGYFQAGDGGGWIYNNDGTRTDKQFSGRGGGSHYQNFIDAVRSRKIEDLNADIEKGHISSALCHMGNISYRIGQHKSIEEIKETIKDNSDLTDSYERALTHLQANEIDFEKEPITIGPILTMDPKTEKFTGELSDYANMYVKRNYREPFVVPDTV
ncbi:MAG: Gfo/Idh/MocA family oxidoreductase [Sedimentisphaerales bacterium]|nr:Gfo/Idh/MocA family oxidoreductase [Sedimentisphaerales bacterium]